MLNDDVFQKEQNIFHSFLQSRFSSYWNSEEFVFKYIPWLVCWASTPNLRTFLCYWFLCSPCDDAESHRIAWTGGAAEGCCSAKLAASESRALPP